MLTLMFILAVDLVAVPQPQQQQYIPQQVQQNMPSAFGDRRGEDVKLNNILKLVEQQGLKLGEMMSCPPAAWTSAACQGSHSWKN